MQHESREQQNITVVLCSIGFAAVHLLLAACQPVLSALNNSGVWRHHQTPGFPSRRDCASASSQYRRGGTLHEGHVTSICTCTHGRRHAALQGATGTLHERGVYSLDVLSSAERSASGSFVCLTFPCRSIKNLPARTCGDNSTTDVTSAESKRPRKFHLGSL